MALSRLMNPAIAAGLLVAYLLLSIEIYLATYTLGTFHLSFWKFGPTELRVLMAMGTLRVFFNPTVQVFGSTYLLLDVGGVISIAGILVVALISVFRHTCELCRLEPLRECNVSSKGDPRGRPANMRQALIRPRSEFPRI
jgi:hypothetical protein